jgi:hypothetical protein
MASEENHPDIFKTNWRDVLNYLEHQYRRIIVASKGLKKHLSDEKTY